MGHPTRSSAVAFLYNTGARVHEAADVRVEHLDLKPPAKVHLHGKGDKWRIWPLWNETDKHLGQLLAERGPVVASTEPVFCARRNLALTRHEIYKIVRRHGASWDTTNAEPRRMTAHSMTKPTLC